MLRFVIVFAVFACSAGPLFAARTSPRPAATDVRTYKVREGDTLGAIAKKYGIGLAELATFNKIVDANDLREGQVLKIPPATAAKAAPARSYILPAATKAALDKMRIVPGKWRYIVIHHSGTSEGTPKGMDAYHRHVRHMENGLAYHFVIGNANGMPDGSIHIGARWRGQLDGGHLASESLNAKAIGICLVGNFDERRPTEKEMQSLQSLVAYLRQCCKLPASAVKLHRQINTRPTECPGKYFPERSFFGSL